MKSSKIQAPTSREIPITKHQTKTEARHWSLKLGASLVLGGWCLVLLFSAFSFQLSAFSQSYSIDWSTIDGGGGTSTGGVFSVSGTIGQPDAGKMSGGNYSVDGGFWGIIAAVQTPGAPLLSVSRSNNVVTVQWQQVAGWNLIQNTDVATPVASWGTSTGITSANGTNYLNLTNSVGNLYFRLKK